MSCLYQDEDWGFFVDLDQSFNKKQPHQRQNFNYLNTIYEEEYEEEYKKTDNQKEKAKEENKFNEDRIEDLKSVPFTVYCVICTALISCSIMLL